MTWDPEVDDQSAPRRLPTEREPSDVGADGARDFGDEPAPAWRDTAPDPLAPIDPDAPVSGHHVAPQPSIAISETPEQNWDAAASVLYPTFRPVGTQGIPIEEIDPEQIATQTARAHVAPLVDEGPAGLPVVYSMRAGGFDVIVNGDHLLSWGVEPAAIQDAALSNLAAWSAAAPWTDEASGDRRLLSSDTGDGWDAARILLPDVVEHLTRELGASGRVLVGLPERHLLVAATLSPGDEEFAGLFAEFIVEQSGGADEPIDRRVFELVNGRLVEFSDLPGA
jgi:hypothetical protein